MITLTRVFLFLFAPTVPWFSQKEHQYFFAAHFPHSNDTLNGKLINQAEQQFWIKF